MARSSSGTARRFACAAFALLASATVWGGAGCGDESDPADSQESDVVVDTKSDLAWKQYLANVDFAEGYRAQCTPPNPEDPTFRPRVLVTGFGRFLENRENATGRIVSRLVPELEYPLTDPPGPDEIDDPAAQLSVAEARIELPGVGEVDVCAMVLPVFWDLASILVLIEAAAFQPDLVLMNGIAGGEQPIWMELGSVNAAVALPDGSGILTPIESGTPLLPGLPEGERARGLLMSWDEVRAATEARIGELADETDELERSFGSVLSGVRYAGYPRDSNTYLCNNTTFVVNYVMDHPGETVRLLEPSDPREGGPTGLDLTVEVDLSGAARDFVHWPSQLSGTHLDRAADVMATIIGAQLGAEEEPTRGDPSKAEIQ